MEPFSVTIKPRINNPALDHNGWVITGGVRKLLTTLPTLSWPEALIAGGYFNKSHAELQFAVPVKFCSIDYDKRYINNAEVVSVDNSDSRFMVTVNLKSDLQASDVFSSVKIIVKTLDDVELPPVSIPLTASIVNDVYVLPSVISFGILEVGQDAEQEFLVVSRTNTSFSVIDRGIPDLSNLKKEDHSDNVFKLHGPLHNQDNDTMSSRQTFRIDLKNAQTGMHMKIFKLRVKQGSAETYEIPIRATYSVVPKD